jgi:hypothetical protein
MGSIIIFSNIVFSVCSTYNAYGFIIFLCPCSIRICHWVHRGQDEQGYSWNTHVTAGTTNPQRKIDFHIRILGL